jgi:hypothetical protein
MVDLYMVVFTNNPGSRLLSSYLLSMSWILYKSCPAWSRGQDPNLHPPWNPRGEHIATGGSVKVLVLREAASGDTENQMVMLQ